MFCSYWAQFKKGKRPNIQSCHLVTTYKPLFYLFRDAKQNSKGGRPPKRKDVGQPMCAKQSGDTSSINVENIMQLDPTKALSDAHERALAYMISIKVKSVNCTK